MTIIITATISRYSFSESAGGLKDISFIMAGLTNWKQALLNGHLPEFDHLDVVSTAIWPDRLLFEELSNVCNNLELPFLTSRHPELIPSVLRGLLEVSINYSKRIIERNKKIQEEDETNNKVEDENDPKFWEQDIYEENLNGESDEMLETTSGKSSLSFYAFNNPDDKDSSDTAHVTTSSTAVKL
jgi:hypothetical protein